MRLYRMISPPSKQTAHWMAAVHEATAAYDFAFLALGHADDEADMTSVRDGEPTRFVTHPDTRAVDGINLLLAGVSAMQATLERWPRSGGKQGKHVLAAAIIEELVRALKEAAFPIILDRAGLGHVADGPATSSGLTPIQIDAESIRRVEAFTRHRAHTYFMRAVSLATLMAGYNSIAPDLTKALDDLFCSWGSLGAGTDDLQDVFVDFAAGTHSVCTVMAHLCVAENATLRPAFRRNVADGVVRDQRGRLEAFFGVTDDRLDRRALLGLLNEIELRRALADHYEEQGALFAGAIYRAAFHFGFDPRVMIEIVSVVCRDPEFSVPDIFLSALRTVSDESVLAAMNVQVGKFITAYFLNRFWPTTADG